MLQSILGWCQPFSVIVFLVSGIVALMLGRWQQGAVNLSFAVANLFIFYGERLLGR
jgi:hypothetical protein